MVPTRIDKWEMRRRFNCGGYHKRALKGEFTVLPYKPRKRPQLASSTSGQVPGTLSGMIEFRDHNNRTIAKLHRFVRPDGTVGASGLPDPKVLFENGTLFHCYPDSVAPSLKRIIWGSINALWSMICRLIGR